MLYDSFAKLLDRSLTAGLIILFILLARAILYRTGVPKIFSYLLWSVVLLRLLCPVTLTSEYALIRDVDTFQYRTDQTVFSDTIVMTNTDIITALPADNTDSTPAAPEMFPETPESGQYLAEPVRKTTVTPAMIGTWIWLTGIAGMIFYSLFSLLKLRRQLVGAVPVRDNIWLADHIPTPFVIGLFRPRIYLPSSLSEKEQEYIILHEQHHIRRGDHIIKLLAFAALAIHWFNPLVWAAFLLSGKDMEMSCDEAVLRKMGKDIRGDYSASLLSLATGRHILAGAPLAFGEGNTKDRIKNALRWKRPALWTVILAAVLCIFIIVGCAFDHKESIELETPFGHSYQVSDILYDAPPFSFTYTLETAPLYKLTEEGELLTTESILSGSPSGSWSYEGLLEECELTEEFDTYFIDVDGVTGWTDDHTTAETLRTNTVNAWTVTLPDGDPDIFYYLLQQENGDLYLTYGYPLIRWVFKLKADEDVQNMTIAQDTYVSSQCIYMNPLSSSLSGSDSGCQYVIADNSITIRQRDGGSIVIQPASWEWKELPYTAEEWKSFFLAGMTDLTSLPEDHLVYGLPLNEDFCLLNVGGNMWIVKFVTPSTGPKYIWSIYSLIPESEMGSAQWEHTPLLSSRLPAFPLRFDLAYDEISVSCMGGQLLTYNSAGELRPLEDNTVTPDEVLCWKPSSEDSLFNPEGQIYFIVSNIGSVVYEGTIYITPSSSNEEGHQTYTASIVSSRLRMSQDENGGAVITPVTALPSEVPAPLPEIQEPVLSDSARSAYQAVLNGLYYDHVWPDGSACEFLSASDISNNDFLIQDIDMDGRKELLIFYSDTYTAGMVLKIYDYDEAAEKIYEQFSAFPAATFYDNGIIQVDASHNHGMAAIRADFWPYSLCQYDPVQDIYVPVGTVDAWDRAQAETDWEGNSFPETVDSDGDNLVYYVMRNGVYELKDPIDNEAYHQWRDSYIGDAQKVQLDYLKMTEENIRLDDR